jgi:hypothetical protein
MAKRSKQRTRDDAEEREYRVAEMIARAKRHPEKAIAAASGVVHASGSLTTAVALTAEIAADSLSCRRRRS